MWEDAALGISSGVLVACLFPMLARSAQVPRTTSVPTFVCLAVKTVALLSLQLSWAAGLSALAAWCWLLIAIYRATPSRS